MGEVGAEARAKVKDRAAEPIDETEVHTYSTLPGLLLEIAPTDRLTTDLSVHALLFVFGVLFEVYPKWSSWH